MRGKEHPGLIHVADWHATFCRLAGLDPAAGEPGAKSPLDALDAWPWLSGGVAGSARSEIVYDHNMFADATKMNASAFAATCYNASGRCARGAVQRRGWKLVVTPEAQNVWAGWFSPNVSDPLGKRDPRFTAKSGCSPAAPCLFDLNASMAEHEDVARDHPAVVAELLAWFGALADTYHPPRHNPPADLSGYCAAVEANQGFVGPWARTARRPGEPV